METEKIPVILGLETISATGSCVIRHGETILAESGNARIAESGLGESLLPTMKTILREAGVHLSEIDLLAIVNGPGSFTGLRLGLATARAFAMALSCRIVGIPTLECGAFLGLEAGRAIVLYPAGRGNYYVQEWEKNEHHLIACSEIRCLHLEEILHPSAQAGEQTLLFMSPLTDEIKMSFNESEMRLITNGDSSFLETAEASLEIYANYRFLRLKKGLANAASLLGLLKNDGEYEENIGIIYGREIRLGKN